MDIGAQVYANILSISHDLSHSLLNRSFLQGKLVSDMCRDGKWASSLRGQKSSAFAVLCAAAAAKESSADMGINPVSMQ